MLKKVNKNTVAGQVINQLTELIRNGRLKPGDRMPSEREMAEALGVSRPPLRESLRALEYAGVIETRYGDGIYVKSAEFPLDNNLFFARLLNQYTLEEMIELRKILEEAAVRFAIERASDEDIAGLYAILERAKNNLDDLDVFVAGDFEFHSAIAELSRNSLLLNTVHTMRKMIDEFNRELLGDKEFREDVYTRHLAILDAIRDRNTPGATAAMEQHLDNVLRLAHKAPRPDVASSVAGDALLPPQASPKKERKPRKRRAISQ